MAKQKKAYSTIKGQYQTFRCGSSQVTHSDQRIAGIAFLACISIVSGCCSFKPSLHSEITRAIEKHKIRENIVKEYLLHGLVPGRNPTNLADGPFGELFLRLCSAPITMPSYAQMGKV